MSQKATEYEQKHLLCHLLDSRIGVADTRVGAC